MADSDNERTESATPQRRQQAFDQGQFARSPDLTNAALAMASIIILRMIAYRVMAQLALLFRTLLTTPVQPGGGAMARQSLQESVPTILHVVIPLMLGLAAVAAGATFLQTGMRFTTRTLKLDFNRLMPSMGMGRLFSQKTWVAMLMNIVKVVLIGAVAFSQIRADIPEIMSLARVGFPANARAAAQMAFALAWRAAGVLFLLGLLDFLYQKFLFERDIRMSRQEIKEEMRSMEGDAQMKGRRRQMAKKMLLQRIQSDVPRADVVVTNPTELAIAIKYDPATMAAPRVVAKGAGFMAMRVRQVAIESNVPLLERKPLAQALYKSVEVGQEVPPQFYQAIAEILAYVYELSGKGSRIRKSA